MKKIILLLAAVLAVALFASCGGPEALADTEILTVRNRNNSKTITIGQTREEADKVTGGDEDSVMEYEDGSERASYRNAPGIFIEYNPEGTVVSFRLSDTDDWETAGGVRIGMSRSDAEAVYADNPYKEPGMSGGLLMAYDKDLKPIKFSDDAPYRLILSFENDKVSYVTIEAAV